MAQPHEQTADWDLSPFFSAHGAEDYQRYWRELRGDVRALAEEVGAAPEVDTGSRGAWADMLRRLEDVSARLGHLSTYLGCAGAADARDRAVKRDAGLLATLEADVDKIFVTVRAALGRASDTEFSALLEDKSLSGAEHFLRRLRHVASRSMDPGLESLAAELSVDGLHAWSRLYDQVSGTLTFELAVPGREPATHPVAMTRTFLEDADPDVRAAAFAGSAVAWEGVAETVAASLNAIAGTRLTLYRNRGIDDFLEPPLHDAAIERATLDCMWDTVRARQDLAREFLRDKAAALGMPKLRYCDLMAPLASGDEARLSWDDGVARVLGAFSSAYPTLGEFARQAIDDRWVDYAPRPGKRPGGFCAGSHVLGQSRIFMTYNGAMGDVQTLAHELGHAFHSWLMRDQRSWQRHYPMTLAETASTFAENLVTNAALSSPETSDELRARILDTRLQDAEAFLLNIPTRFDFECAVYQRRREGELSVEDFCDLMVESQRKNYGEALAEDSLDPWFWASKLHFYIAELSFYNFPYTFGYLFSMGLFARYLEEGDAFLPRYEALLRATGSAPAEEIAREHLGVDLARPDFWNASLDLVQKDAEAFRKLR